MKNMTQENMQVKFPEECSFEVTRCCQTCRFLDWSDVNGYGKYRCLNGRGYCNLNDRCWDWEERKF